jgi:hypothetical protein
MRKSIAVEQYRCRRSKHCDVLKSDMATIFQKVGEVKRFQQNVLPKGTEPDRPHRKTQHIPDYENQPGT